MTQKAIWPGATSSGGGEEEYCRRETKFIYLSVFIFVIHLCFANAQHLENSFSITFPFLVLSKFSSFRETDLTD